jgi:hypothetical protein
MASDKKPFLFSIEKRERTRLSLWAFQFGRDPSGDPRPNQIKIGKFKCCMQMALYNKHNCSRKISEAHSLALSAFLGKMAAQLFQPAIWQSSPMVSRLFNVACIQSILLSFAIIDLVLINVSESTLVVSVASAS